MESDLKRLERNVRELVRLRMERQHIEDQLTQLSLECDELRERVRWATLPQAVAS